MPATGRSGHIVIAPDKFKGSLTAAEAAAHIAAGLRRRRPTLEFVQLPVADGGDGTLAAAISAGFRRVPVEVAGPTGEPVRSAYAEREGTALVELADASGVRRLPDGKPAPLTASSFGTGQLIRAALDAGCRTVVLGIGGSACTDGGAGLLEALGARLLDSAGEPLARGGAALASIDRLDVSGLHPPLAAAKVVVAIDVDNPLLGPFGAAAVYGPQKGASPSDMETLDRALARWAAVVTQVVGRDVANEPGAGAAGGVGFAALALLDATLVPGITLVLDLLRFPDQVRGARLVITGEGSLDRQTLRGKAPVGVARAARAAGVPVVAMVGRSTLTPEQLESAGIAAVYALTDIESDVARCMAEAGPLLEELAGGPLLRDLELLVMKRPGS